MIGKGLLLPGPHGRGTTAYRTVLTLDVAAAHRVHEIAQIQPLTDSLGIIGFTARTERVSTLFHHLRCQRDVGCDHQVPGADASDDLVISNIES